MPRLLLAGTNSVHTFNYLKLIEGFFDEVLLVTTSPVKDYPRPYLYYNFSLRNPVSAYRTVRSLRKKINEYRPDIIHLHQANSVAYLTLQSAKHLSVPKILTAWGSDILTTPSFGFLYREMVKWNLNHSDYFTADANYVAGRMKTLCSQKNFDVSVINFGIDINFPVVEKENIIYSNRLHKKFYRVDKIILAFKKLVENNPSEKWKLIIAAEGEETNNLKILTANSGLTDKVEFKGWLSKEENNSFYAKAKIFVSVPESDATSVSLLEAMAAGCIPVVSDLPANREWIIQDENGFIVGDFDSNFLEAAVHASSEKIKALNQTIIQERGTKEVARKNFIDLYRKILKTSG